MPKTFMGRDDRRSGAGGRIVRMPAAFDPHRWPAGLLAALALRVGGGTVLIARSDLAVRQAAFETDARIAHRLLSQRASQHDAILATLALLQPPAAEAPEQRLPSFVGQVLQVLRRDAGTDWPGDADQRAALAAAEQQSRPLQRAVMAQVALGGERGRYALVRAATPASFALVIDARALVPAADWPFAPGGPVQVSLAQRGQVQALVAAAGPLDAAAWHFAFRKPLATDSQPFELVVQRPLRVAELPWVRIGLWWLALAAAGWGYVAWQAQRRAQRRAQELLRLGQVGRLNALGELAAGMAHELNQPLTAVSAGVQAAQRLLADDPPDLATARQAMAQAVQQSRRAADVVARLRRLVERPDVASRLQPCALQATLRGGLDLLAPEAQRLGVSVEWQADAAGLQVQADPVALEQIVHNLLNNALQALAAVPVGERRLRLGVRRDGDAAVVDIADSGPGIAAEALPRLFEPFFTTREGGLGLGLSLCESLASGMGGALSAANASPRGAVFTLRLPTAAPNA